MGDSKETIDGLEARNRLSSVLRDDAPFREQAKRALEVGVDYFDVQNGHVAAIDGEMNRWEAIASTDPPGGTFPPGLTLDLQTTYCRIAVEQQESVTLHDASQQGWGDDPAYAAHELDCYHGTPLRVGDELYGTVCFVDEVPREEQFSESETLFAELVAEKLGRILEQRRYEHDINERGRALRAHRRWLRGLVEASSDVIFRLTPDYTFSFVSDQAESVLGYTPRELHGESFTTVFRDGGATASARDGFDTATEGQTVELPSIELRSADGRTVYADVRVVPVYPEPGADGTNGEEPVAVQGVVRDVTERWRFEQLSSVLNRVLRHNVRNKMNVVLGRAEQLRHEQSGEVATIAATISDTAIDLVSLGETARRMEQCIREEEPTAAMDIVPHVEAAVGQVRDSYPDADISFDSPEAVCARATPAIETVADELAANAAAYTGDEPSIHIRVETDATSVRIVVIDDGPGLNQGDCAVLESGEETSLKHGSGLGLLLVYWLVTGMSGGVDVTVDSGTVITVTLNRASGQQ